MQLPGDASHAHILARIARRIFKRVRLMAMEIPKGAQYAEALQRIHGLLGSALVQALPSDDQIIIEKIRKADEIALTAMRSLR